MIGPGRHFLIPGEGEAGSGQAGDSENDWDMAKAACHGAAPVNRVDT
jgi:hypothetical protein